MDEKVIAIDLDGTILEYSGWKGANIFGKILKNPVTGKTSVEALNEIREAGHKIIIHTCRLHTPELEKFLNDNKIPYDAINENPWHQYKQKGDKRKVIADIYIDDRAITFKGNWDEIPELVNNFKTWEME